MMVSDFPALETKRARLRQITQADIHNIYIGLSNPEVVKYYGVSFATVEAAEEQMLWFKELEKTGTGIWWAITSKQDNLFYGAAGFNNVSDKHKKAEIGFWLLPQFWGQGLMQEVFPVVCHYGFEKLNLHRIEGFVDSENKSCKKAIEKMNFLLEGTMKECEIKEGKYLNLDIYAKLKGV